MQSQKKVWDNIANEWERFKKKPSRFTIDFLKNQYGNVLDLGSGSGRHLIKIKKGKMFLVDFSPEMIKQAKENAKTKKINAECIVSEMNKLPFENNFFDAAIVINSLHCVEGKPKIKKVVKELYRVLKVGAKVKIDLWNKDSKRFKNSPKETYINWNKMGKRYYYLFTPDEAYKLFEDCGFKIIKKTDPARSLVFVVLKV